MMIISGVEMDIWEPCNYVSNLAYDRLLVEMCVQQVMRTDSLRSQNLLSWNGQKINLFKYLFTPFWYV